jgi:hypothetical protein
MVATTVGVTRKYFDTKFGCDSISVSKFLSSIEVVFPCGNSFPVFLGKFVMIFRIPRKISPEIRNKSIIILLLKEIRSELLERRNKDLVKGKDIPVTGRGGP